MGVSVSARRTLPKLTKPGRTLPKIPKCWKRYPALPPNCPWTKLVLEALCGYQVKVPSIEKNLAKLYTPSTLGPRLLDRCAVCNAVNPAPTSNRGVSWATAMRHPNEQEMITAGITLPNRSILFRDHASEKERQQAQGKELFHLGISSQSISTDAEARQRWI